MKHKKQNQEAAFEDEQNQSAVHEDNGLNGSSNGQYSEEDKEKGNFKNFDISKKTIKKLKARNIEYLYPVQRESFATVHEQSDCIIQASSGSGKTLAFAIPIVELLQNDKSVVLESGRAPRAVVIGSTRDIVKQISEDFESILNNLSVVTIFSAKKKSDDQESALANGCDILVATPDRLQEFIDNQKVDLSQIKHVVLDEIDRMLDAATMEHLKTILKNVFVAETKPQLIVFSETIPDSVRKLTKKYLAANSPTITVAEKSTQGSPAEAEEEEEEDEEDSNESFTVKSNKKPSDSSVSLLTKQPNYTTYQLSTNDEIKGVGFVFTMLRKVFGDDFDAKSNISKVAFTKDFTSAIFDLPSELDEQLQSTWKDSARIQMGPITELPDIDESSITDTSFSRGSSKPRGGGSGGSRDFGRSNACFKCQKEGHKSYECPEANGGNKSGGGCFNCGKDGHKSFDCPEPKKAGGRSGGAGGGGCFNCGKDGHKSFECPEPKKGGGRSGGAGGGGCFNCGNEGHKSFECPEPKKGRPSGGPGGRGGARGGRGGFKRTFGGAGENGHGSGEVSNKKIKFDDDE